MVAEIDYLIVLVPYDDNTRNLIDAATFKAMKPSSRLINIARGGRRYEGLLRLQPRLAEVGEGTF